MNAITIKYTAKSGVVPPSYKTSGAAGADVCAFLDSPVVIGCGERAMIPTGLCFEIPEGFEIQVRPRSGLAAKNGVTVLNTPGTIDSDYRGEIKVGVINQIGEAYTIEPGERVAQMVILPVSMMPVEEVETLGETDRGAGGFGSTGTK